MGKIVFLIIIGLVEFQYSILFKILFWKNNYSKATLSFLLHHNYIFLYPIHFHLS